MVEVHGCGGELKTGGRLAARLGTWELRPQDGGCRISAALVERDEFWLDEGGTFTLTLSWGTREKRWRDATLLAIQGDSVAIQTKESKADG